MSKSEKFVARRTKKSSLVPTGGGSPLATECPHTEKKAWARKMCKSCYNKWLVANNPQYAAAQQANRRKWYRENTEYAKTASRDQQKNRTYQQKRARILRQYGMTPDDYDAILSAQGGGCAICRGKPGKRPLNVDHCHETGKVRGLLCFRCNYGLSYFKEDAARLSRASVYLADAQYGVCDGLGGPVQPALDALLQSGVNGTRTHLIPEHFNAVSAN